jgi:hypothetical protein
VVWITSFTLSILQERRPEATNLANSLHAHEHETSRKYASTSVSKPGREEEGEGEGEGEGGRERARRGVKRRGEKKQRYTKTKSSKECSRDREKYKRSTEFEGACRHLLVHEGRGDAERVSHRCELNATVGLQHLRVGLDAHLAAKVSLVLAHVHVALQLFDDLAQRHEEEFVVTLVETVQELRKMWNIQDDREDLWRIDDLRRGREKK